MSDYFGPITGRYTFDSQNGGLESLIVGPHPVEIVKDVAALRVDTRNLKNEFLRNPLPISITSPKKGDEVLAIGYPVLGSKAERSALGFRTFQEELHGAPGIITEVFPNGRSKQRSWPTFQIEGNWRSGMSGGPVINRSGQVIGIVSSSIAATIFEPGIGYALSLPHINIRTLVPELDPDNPGWILGWGVFLDDNIKGFFATEDEANSQVFRWTDGQVKQISLDIKNSNWLLV